MILVIKIPRKIIKVNSFEGKELSRIPARENEGKAIKRNFPLALISISSNFIVSRENLIPVINKIATYTNINELRNQLLPLVSTGDIFSETRFTSIESMDKNTM